MRIAALLVPAVLGLAGCASVGGGLALDSRQPGRIVTIHNAAVPGRDGGIVPYLLTAGVENVADAALAAALRRGELDAARIWLTRRLQAPRREQLGLGLHPAALHGAPCADYEAVQADRYDPEPVLPDRIGERRQYVQHGLLCAHPRAADQVVLLFYNESFWRDGMPAQRIGAAELRAFFEQTTWDGPQRAPHP